MDKTVIILIGAGVCCVVIGFALFIKLLTTKQNDDDEAIGNKKLLDDEYAENFKECFDNTGNIEETLEQLTQIYIDDQYMYNLIVSAIDYIKDEQGDYETALEKINVDSDMSIMKMHNAAIKKALNIEIPPHETEEEHVELPEKPAKKKEKKKTKAVVEEFDEDEEEEIPEVKPEPKPAKTIKKVKKIEPKEFEEDEDEDIDEFESEVESDSKPETSKPVKIDMDDFDDDDLDDFKIG